MSHYEWEAGTLKIPGKEWSKVRKSFLAFAKEQSAKSYELSKIWAQRANEHAKAKQGTPPRDSELIKTKQGGTKLWLTPSKKDCQVLQRIGVEGDVSLRIDLEAIVTLNQKTKTVKWSVAENNRAVERANESEIGKWFWNTMRAVNWTRGSGGVLVGNDEYNRDSDNVGGGGNYITHRFGPAGKNHDPYR